MFRHLLSKRLTTAYYGFGLPMAAWRLRTIPHPMVERVIWVRAEPFHDYEEYLMLNPN